MKNADSGTLRAAQPFRYQKEPAVYEEEYYYYKRRSIPSVVLGSVLIIIGVIAKINDENTVHIPLVTIVGGLFFLYAGIRGVQEKSPQLKLAKEGLWTKKLGFVNWKDIARTQVVEETIGNRDHIYLDIYLKGKGAAEKSQPDERLVMTYIEDNQYVEMVIHTLTKKTEQSGDRSGGTAG